MCVRVFASQEPYRGRAPVDVAEDHPLRDKKKKNKVAIKKVIRGHQSRESEVKCLLTTSAGANLTAGGLWRGVGAEVCVGRPDRLVWDELVVLGKLSPKPRSSSSSVGEALVIPGWVSCSRGRDSGRDSSPSKPAFWLFCLSSAVAPLSSCFQEHREEGWIWSDFTASLAKTRSRCKPGKTYNRNLDDFAGVAVAVDACCTDKTNSIQTAVEETA